MLGFRGIISRISQLDILTENSNVIGLEVFEGNVETDFGLELLKCRNECTGLFSNCQT